ncbi:Probable RNA-directed DNA polymerase from transposon BS [Eumeta japonica]|uniref:Probable RNA-directed DNA polymerase from transposon BS n=1 Tax=Eumeta variegata TaxID=151549 RepID=A0A4C1SMR6_EUMVA|nr:Probable RNA-directed DNA polymerase from transposon BS [Eumeta japonica]
MRSPLTVPIPASWRTDRAPPPTRVAATCGRRPHAADPRVVDPRADGRRRYLRPPSRAPRPARRRPTRCYLRTANPRVPFGPAYYLSSYLLPTRAPATGLQISDSDIEHGKRSSSVMSSNESSEQSDVHSDDTIKGSDNESVNSFVVYNKKRRNPKRRAVRRHTEQTDNTSNTIPMETEQIAIASAIAKESSGSPINNSVASTSPKQVNNGASTNSTSPINNNIKNNTPIAPPRAKLPPPVYLRDKTKWNTVSSECTRLHIQYAKAQNTANGIKITLNSIDDFRKINKYLISNNIPFHTFALEEERKSKAVIKGVPTEIETDDIKQDLEQQGYSVHAVHRMHRRDGSTLNMVLAILDKSEKAKDIHKNLSKICGLSGIWAEAPYRRGMPGQCHRCQLYGHAAANCYAQPRCVKCKVPHWTKECERTKEAGEKPSCCDCGQSHTANYGGCPFAPKPRPVPRLNKPKTVAPTISKPTVTPPTNKTSAGDDGFRPAPVPSINPWARRKEEFTAKETTRREPPKPPTPLRHAGSAASALGEDITTIMSILQVVRSAEVSALAAKFRKAKHGVDRLQIILENQDLINRCPYQPSTVVESSSRTVPANSDRENCRRCYQVRDKNAALRRAGKYPTCENRSCARTLQRKVKERIKEVRNENWSDLMSEITPSHKAYWGLAKAMKTEGTVPTPALKRPDMSIAFDDREKAECLADSIELQCSDNPPYDLEHARRVEEEVRNRVTLPPEDDLDPITQDEISKHIKGLKIRKAPGRDTISSKALKCFSAPLVSLLVAIFNACIQNCYFPTAWKEAVVIGIPKPGKPRDLPASYRPISLLSVLGKLFEKTLKTRLSDQLIGKGLIINEQFGFRPHHSCPQQALRLVEHISEGFKVKRKTVAVFFDVAKAFDRVWHAGLIHKLYQLELPDRLVLIIHHYISNRHFSFRLDNTYSSMRPIRAGVPQGSTLSPLL